MLTLARTWISDDHRLFIAYYGPIERPTHAIVEEYIPSDGGIRAKLISVDPEGHRQRDLVVLYYDGHFAPVAEMGHPEWTEPLELDVIDLAMRWARRYGSGWTALGFGQGLP